MTKKKIYISLSILVAAALVTLYVCNRSVINSAKGKTFTDIKTIPYNKVGLLLGTAKYLGKGITNPYYTNRIAAAVELLKESKIKYIIISGDNGTMEYNEPKTMQTDLLNLGIDSSHIFLDYAGFRTFDSIIRLKEIFGQDSVTIISQQFHNERAIYTAAKLGIYAIGFNAKDVSTKQGIKTQIREKFARVKVVLDFLFGKEPKFLGERITIPA